jgi:NTP pyrophosphatase (non-canonical NTP hydrolase)
MISMEDILAFSETTHDAKKPLTFDSYQVKAALTAIYPLTTAVLYPALGLAGEAGEVANKVKKIIRDGTFDRAGIAAEMGDCLWYLALLARDLNLDLSDIARENLNKLERRKAEGKLKGSGDDR